MNIKKISIDSQQVHLKNSLALGFEYSLVEYKIESIFCCAYVCSCAMDFFCTTVTYKSVFVSVFI